jgi:hypothetical protein
MAVGNYFTSSGYVFKSIKNPDVFQEYEKTTVEVSPEFISNKAENSEKFLCLYDSNEAASLDIKNNVECVLGYMKKEFKSVDINNYISDFSGYSCIIIGFERIECINNFDWIFQYVNNGGNLIFAERPIDSDNFDLIYSKLGIINKGESINIKSLNVKTNILIKGNGLKRESFSQNDVIEVKLCEDCKIHCVSNEGVPLIWERVYGKGKILFVNGQFLDMKENRGLLSGTIGLAGNEFIYPIINAKLDFLDDFPSPSPNEYNKEIYDEFGKNVVSFYKEIWWPDMLKESNLYNIKYSSAFIETYNDLVTHQDLKKDRVLDDKNNLIIFGRDVLKNGGEIGIHGYNHQPLALKDFIKYEDKNSYKSWESNETMAESLEKVSSYINEVYPGYEIRSYVPPSNILSPEGRQVIRDNLPNLKIISSLYIDSIDDSDGYLQEFKVAKDGIIDLPRISDGYKMTDDTKWNIYNALTTHGVFSHFVHPDDILDPERNFGENWESLFEDYQEIQSCINENFPWVRPLTVSDAGVELMRYYDCNTVFKYDEKGIQGVCEGFKKEAYYILRTEKEIRGSKGCNVSKIDNDVYEVIADKPEFHIELGDKK